MQLKKILVSGWIMMVAGYGVLRTEPSLRVIGGGNDYCIQPQWSSDGEWLAFTSAHYQGIQVVHPNGTGRNRLTQAEGAGYRFIWHPSRLQILARTNSNEIYRFQRSIRVYDCDSLTEQVILPFTGGFLGLPQWIMSGAGVAFYRNGKLVISTMVKRGTAPDQVLPAFPVVGDQPADQTSPFSGQIVTDDRNQIYMVIDTLQPAEQLELLPGKECLNVAVSPDGEWLAFEELGGHLYIRNMKTHTLQDCGWGNRPAWSPDSRYLVYMQTRDDGHQFLDSDLYMLKISNLSITSLTSTPDRLEMNPAWSPRGDEIAFDTYSEGTIYRMKVRLP